MQDHSDDPRPFPEVEQVRTCEPAASRLPVRRSEVTGLAWSKDSNSVAGYSAYGTQVTIWNADNCRELHTFTVHDNRYVGKSIAFASGSAGLITPASLSSRDDNKYTLSIWDVAKEAVIQNIEGPGAKRARPWEYAVSADQSLLALTIIGFGVPVSIYDLTSLKIVRSLPVAENGARDDAWSVSFSAVGSSLAVGKLSGKVAVYEHALNSQADEFEVYAPSDTIGVGSTAFSPDGTMLATGARVAHELYGLIHYSSIKVWRISDHKLIAEFVTRGGTVETLDWHPNGQYVAAAMHDHSLLLVAPEQGQFATLNAMMMNSGQVYAAAFSPDGKRLAAATELGLMIFTLRADSDHL